MEEGKGVEDWAAADTPFEVTPNMGLPVCGPNGVVLPKIWGAEGSLLVLRVCLETDWDINGLLYDCSRTVKQYSMN